MEAIYLISRIVLGGYFFFNGISHLAKTGMMAAYTGSKGVPFPTLAVVGSGLQLAVGGVMLLLGWYMWVGALVLIAFLVPAALIMHSFWTVRDQQMRMMEMVQFMKNTAIAGALLMVLAYDYSTGWNPWGLGP